jgi:hypothetical protein
MCRGLVSAGCQVVRDKRHIDNDLGVGQGHCRHDPGRIAVVRKRFSRHAFQIGDFIGNLSESELCGGKPASAASQGRLRD